jgi:predicted ribosome quality control (RQC) complex YloA/Tae2 family protein
MARITLDLTATIEENAAHYFERAKKVKKKIDGAREALEANKKKLDELILKRNRQLEKENSKPLQRKKEWYEKFRWFLSSEGFLVVGGRDATSNEIVVKKHTDANDLVFHTDMAGSPFFVIKSEGKGIGKNTMQETADATCTFSRAWKMGLQATSVFYVSPEQVSKKTQSGEFMGKGAFMIYGKTNYIDNKLNLSVGINDAGQIMSGPVEAVSRHCKKHVRLIQGSEKTSTIAKQIRHLIGGDLDEIVRALPAGEFKIKK